MAKKKRRKSADFLVSTIRLHAVHDPEQNARIVDACTMQRAVRNRTTAHLLTHRSDGPLRKNTGEGVTGVYGHLTAWRKQDPAAAAIPLVIARGGAAAAADQIAKWETTNLDHAIEVAKAVEAGNDIPRHVQRRIPDGRRLFRSRKRDEREGRHVCRIDEKVQRINAHTLWVQGIGELRTEERIPARLDIRSCVIVERTPKPRLQRKLDASERTFRIHVGGRLPRPAPRAGDDVGRSCGVDHGIVHQMTAVGDDGEVETFNHDVAAAETSRRLRKLGRKMSGCRRGSRRWKRRKEARRQLHRKAAAKRRHQRRSWANRLCRKYETVCVEELQTANMTRSARGTNEQHGKKVSQKRGLNRSLLAVAPAEQNAILERVGARVGARVELVPAAGTSISCSTCGQRDRDSRESQAVFRCRACGYAANADVNAARNVRARGVGAIRARMGASAGPEGSERSRAGRRSGRQERSRRRAAPDPPERAAERR